MMTTTIGTKVKKALKDRGLSQGVLAELTRITKGQLSRLINGKRKWGRHHAEAVARALDLKVEELVEGTDDVALLQPNGDYVERAYVEQLAEELAQATVRLQEVTGENAALRAINEDVDKRLAAAINDVGRLREEHAAALREAAHAKESARKMTVQVKDYTRVLAQREQSNLELATKNANLDTALKAAYRQVMINYDAWAQANARAKQLEEQLGQSSGRGAAAALFAGLVGLGVGVAAMGSSSE